MKKTYLLLCFSLFAVSQLYSQSGIISTYAGVGTPGYNGDGLAATNAQIDTSQFVATDDSLNLYIADAQSNRIRKVYASSGLITTIAGNGTVGYSGDFFLAINAQIFYPIGIALDAAGNVYFTDAGNVVVRKITKATGIITTIAGNDLVGNSGDGGPATSAEFTYPTGIAVDDTGNVYIADAVGECVRKLRAADGLMYQYAGNNTQGFSGDGGPATSAQLNQPLGIALDKNGDLYIADASNFVVRKVDAFRGLIGTYAGVAGNNSYDPNSGPATSEPMSEPTGVSCDKHGNLYVADPGDDVIRQINISTGYDYVVAGNANAGFSGDGGPAINAELGYPFGIAVDTNGNLYINDLLNLRIRKVTAYPTAVPEIASKGGFSIYPNPATDVLNIQFANNSGKNTIEIVDITGRMVSTFEKNVNAHTILPIDVSNYPAGIYFVKISGSNNSEVFKFVKE